MLNMQTSIRWKQIGLNIYRKDAQSQKSILACKHFDEPNHNFQQHAQFTLIKQINPTKKETKRQKKTSEKSRNFLNFKTKIFTPGRVKLKIK